MILDILSLFVVFLLSIRLIVALSNLCFSVFKASRATSGDIPLVSVLIPARNEAQRIPTLLTSLLKDPSLNIEVLVYDDMSGDGTAQVVNAFAVNDSRARLLSGTMLPQGWLGKNYACSQLASFAKGDYLLFLDADVRLDASLIPQAVSYAMKKKLVLLSLFPVQIMNTLPEMLTVPLMNRILVSLLPLKLTRLSRRPSLSAANGQFMLFEASTYHKYHFHELVKNQKVEDIKIFRLIKKISKKLPRSKRLRAETLLGNKKIQCRMYDGWEDAMNGFSKNVIEFFGGKPLLAASGALIFAFGFLLPLLAWGWMAGLLYLLVSLFLCAVVSFASIQPVFKNLLLSPLQQLCLVYLVAYAWVKKNKRNNIWKGRNVDA